MTIVAAMKLSPEFGMGCSDERVTRQTQGTSRAYDTNKKMYKLGSYSFVGSAGSVEFANVVIDTTRHEIKDSTPTSAVPFIIRDVAFKKRDEIRQIDGFRYFSVDSSEYLKKDPNINPETLRDLQLRLKQIDDLVDTDFIFLGYDYKEGLILYKVPGCLEPRNGLNHRTTGSGADLADATISKYLQRMNPSEREDINMAKGCRILMKAVRESWQNTGVGGRTTVLWTGKDVPVTELGYDESDALQNLLYLEQRRIVDTDTVDGIFRDVIEHEAKYSDIKKRLARLMPKDKLVDIFFSDGLHN